MRWAVTLVNTLKLALVLGDASDRVEDHSGMTNVSPDRANMTVNLTENGEENGFTLCE